MNMRFFCDTAWNHKNVQSKIAQKNRKNIEIRMWGEKFINFLSTDSVDKKG